MMVDDAAQSTRIQLGALWCLMAPITSTLFAQASPLESHESTTYSKMHKSLDVDKRMSLYATACKSRRVATLRYT